MAAHGRVARPLCACLRSRCCCPPACALTKARPRTAVVVTVVLAGLSFGYGAYLLTLSPIAL